MIGARVHRGSLIAPPRVFCVSECAKWEDAHFSLCITARREDKGSWIMLRLYVSCLSPKPLPALPAQPQPEVTGFPGTWKWNHSTRAALMSLHISSLTGLDVIVSLCCLFFVFFPRPDVPCHVCTSVVTMHEGDSKRTRGGWACEKWMPFWMHERRRARVMCHRGGGTAWKCWSNPRAPAVFIPYSAEFNIEGLGAVKTYQSHDAYSWYNVLGRGTFFHVERHVAGAMTSLTLDGWVERSEVCCYRTEQMVSSCFLPLFLFFFFLFPRFFLFQSYTASQFPVNRKWWPNFLEWAVCRENRWKQ